MDEYSDIPHFGFSRDQELQGLRQVMEDLFTWPINSRRWRVIQWEVLAVLRGRAQARETTISVELLRAARTTLGNENEKRTGIVNPLNSASTHTVTKSIHMTLVHIGCRKP